MNLSYENTINYKEEFYRKFGFEKRPTEILGCAMSMWIQ